MVSAIRARAAATSTAELIAKQVVWSASAMKGAGGGILGSVMVWPSLQAAYSSRPLFFTVKLGDLASKTRAGRQRSLKGLAPQIAAL
jgi:hypothetical protein